MKISKIKSGVKGLTLTVLITSIAVLLFDLQTRQFEEEMSINPFKPEFPIVIFIHYKPRIAVTILDL